MVFADRAEAGRRLAARLGHLKGEPVVVLGLPRGGVPVAFQVARALGAPLDVIVVRKLGVPFQPELGMGAVGEDGVRVLSPEVIGEARVPGNEVAAVQAREQAAVQARAARYRSRRARQPRSAHHLRETSYPRHSTPPRSSGRPIGGSGDRAQMAATGGLEWPGRWDGTR